MTSAKTVAGVVICLFVILGPGTYALAWFSAGQGNQNFLTDFWGFSVTEPTKKPTQVEGYEMAQFTATLYKEDTSTVITEESVYIWYDWNGNGAVDLGQFEGYLDGELLGPGEIEPTSSAATTGVITSPSEYPIGPAIWVFVDDEGEAYQMTYKQVAMTGEPNSDGSAKPAGNIYCRATDDGSISYAGLIRGVAIDDSTDYNYTLNGATGEFEIRVTWATSDAGVNSQTNPNFYDPNLGYWVHWGSEKEYAPTFVGGYCTNADAEELGIDSGDFDFWYEGSTNTYFARYLCDFDSLDNLFYDSDDDSAPTFSFTFDVDISAAGALVYVGIFQDIEWSDFTRGNWNPTTDAYILGTLGADWDWTA